MDRTMAQYSTVKLKHEYCDYQKKLNSIINPPKKLFKI